MRTSSEQSLSEQAAAIHDVIRASGTSLRPPEDVQAVVLAQFFLYNVAKGGFAQLLYNAQGQYLAEIENMLSAANALVAARFYERAIHLCVENRAEYQAFLAGDFIEPNELKDALHGLSIEYFREKHDFIEEAASFVASSAERVQEWVQSHSRNAG